MKITAASALCGATAVAALSVPCQKRDGFDLGEQIGDQISDTLETIGETIEELIMLPLEQFGWFNTISLEEAKAGVIKHHSHNSSSTVTSTSLTPSATPSGVKTVNNSRIGGAKTTSLQSGKNNTSTGITTASPSSSSAASTSGFATSTSSSAAPSSTAASNSTIVSNSTSSAADGVMTAQAVCSDNPNVRYEWRDYSDSDRHAFVDAIKCLMKKPSSGNFSPAGNRYEDIVRVHQMMTDTIHGNNIFLLWHRYYTWTLEQIMRDECGFDRAFPWWDETKDAGAFNQSSIFTPDFFGTLSAATDGQGTCVTDGAFANTTLHIGPGTGFTNHCLARAVDESLTAQCNEDFVDTCNSRTSYPDMENCAELGPHAYGHNGVGSVMADVSASPGDPTFFMHHLFIDHGFWMWQNGNDTRLSTIDGCIDSNSPCTPLDLDTIINVQGLRPNVTVADILNTENGAMCYTYNY